MKMTDQQVYDLNKAAAIMLTHLNRTALDENTAPPQGQELLDAVASMQKTNPGMEYADAVDAVLVSDPSLYNKYRLANTPRGVR